MLLLTEILSCSHLKPIIKHKTIDYFIFAKNDYFGKVTCYFEYCNSYYALIEEFVSEKKYIFEKKNR